jgi:hypothetical protein
MDEFEMTAEGCEKALEYLKSIGEDEAIEKEQSTDGYTVVALANDFRSKEG